MLGGAMLTPEADIPVDIETVASLIEAQRPDLSGRLTLIADGWDNVIYRLGEHFAVRVPRRKVAVPLLVNEQKWLPRFASRLPVDVPAPVHIGRPSDVFEWPWSILPWFEGTDGAEATGAERAAVAHPLAEFVAALHVPAPVDEPIPHNPVRGVALATRDAAVRERIVHLAERQDVGALTAAWEHALAAPAWDGPPIWLHGDLHPGNLLLTSDRAGLRAVIDFGDLTAGDPATDLATAWLTFEPDARDAFRSRLTELTTYDDATWQRGLGWAVAMGTALATHSDDNPRMAAIGRHALDQLAANPTTATSTPD
jgi:aminoglycoside phosphotransferase (APT) family kinase protein